jgi:hypothetical protein
MDGKDPNAIADGVQRQGFVEAKERGLTHDIGGHYGYGLHASDTRQIDDASLVACAHSGEHGVGVEKRASVNQQRDRSQALFDRRHNLGCALWVGRIGWVKMCSLSGTQLERRSVWIN